MLAVDAVKELADIELEEIVLAVELLHGAVQGLAGAVRAKADPAGAGID